jgi:ribonuclease P/MRP protein subunit POP3
MAHPDLQQTRLVQLPQGSESGLCSSLGLPRASFIGISEDTPHSKPLVDLVRDVVPTIEVSWLKEAQNAQYMPVKVNTILTTIPLPKNNQKRN